MATTYFSIALQARSGDKREQTKMRRIIYVELTASFIELDSMVWNVRSVDRKPRLPNSKGEIHPPSMRVLNSFFTFEGEEYMRQHHSVAYELPKMVELKRMYKGLSHFSPGNIVSVGALEVPLVKFRKVFKENVVIKNNFRAFASGEDFTAIERIATHFADHVIPAEDLLVLVPTKTSDASE